jgi:hypothetical protein
MNMKIMTYYSRTMKTCRKYASAWNLCMMDYGEYVPGLRYYYTIPIHNKTRSISELTSIYYLLFSCDVHAGRCRLEVKAWGKSGEAADGYIRVTDLLTNYVDEWTANVAGDYFATVDMSSCAVTNRNYFTWSQAAAEGTALYNTWNSQVTGANYINVIGIELGVGPSPGLPLGSYAPWIVVNTLGKGIAVPVLCNGKHHSYSAVLTGKFASKRFT